MCCCLLGVWDYRSLVTPLSVWLSCSSSEPQHLVWYIFFPNFKLFIFIGVYPGGSDKESAYSVGDLGSVPGLGRSPGEENVNPLQYSCLENFRDRGTCWAIVHGITKSQTWLSDLNTHRWLTMLWWLQVNSEGTQPYIYMYPFSHKPPSHLGWRITLSRVPCAIQ